MVENDIADAKAQALALMITANAQTNNDPPPTWHCWIRPRVDEAAGKSLQAH